MVDTQGENSKFPSISRRVRYFKEEQEGVSYEIVQKSMTDLEKEVLDKMYAEVMEEKGRQ